VTIQAPKGVVRVQWQSDATPDSIWADHVERAEGSSDSFRLPPVAAGRLDFVGFDAAGEILVQHSFTVGKDGQELSLVLVD
jgi:hypothetical protein